MIDLTKIEELKFEKVIDKIEDVNGLVVYEAFKELIASGVPPITLNKCKNANLIDYKIYGNSEGIRLPDEYQEVEYIQTTGQGQYINTKINTYNYNKIRIINKFVTTGRNLGTAAAFVYTDNNNGQYAYVNLYHDVYYYVEGTNKFATYSANGSKNITSQKYLIDVEISSDLTWTTTNVVGNINNETVNTTIPGGKKTNSILYLFNMASDSTFQHIAKLYYTKIYANDKLVRDYVPCYRKSDNEIGMYDLVNNVFYTSAGSDSFQKGKDIEIQGVGVKTKNLFDISKSIKSSNGLELSENEDGSYNLRGAIKQNYSYLTIYDLDVPIPTGTYVTLSSYFDTDITDAYIGIICYDADGVLLRQGNGITNGSYLIYRATSDIAKLGMVWRLPTSKAGDYVELNNIRLQLEIGSEKTDYEPYGYKIPVKIYGNPYQEPIITNIYLNESLKGNEYISYKEDNLPSILLNKGTNVIKVETEVLPNNIEINYFGKGKNQLLTEEENVILNSILADDTETRKDIFDYEIIDILDRIIGG